MGKHNPHPQKHRPKSSYKGGKLLLQELLESKPKHPVAFVNTLPYKSLRKHVLWLSLPQQDAIEDVTLTKELESFAEYVKMDQSEEAARGFMIDDITQAIRNVFPSAQIRPFGSYAVSLSTFLSDVDITVEHLDAAVPPAPISISSTDRTASDVMIINPNKRHRTLAAETTEPSGAAPVKKLDIASNTHHLQEVRANKDKPPPSSSSSSSVVSLHQVIDLTVDTSSSDQRGGVQPLKRCRTQLESDSGSGYTLSSITEERVDPADTDFAQAYALADSYDLANKHNNRHTDAQTDAEIALLVRVDDYWHSHSDEGESNMFSDNDDSKTSFSPVKASTSSSDSLQRQADIEGNGGWPQFVFARDEPRQLKVARLQRIFDELQDQRWTHRVEFRRHARVPIINLTHNSSVDCDISLNTPEESTSAVIRTLARRCGPALVKLSAFLKIYLNQLSLDAPFTGGLGSYKLYVLLAKHIADNPQVVGNLSNPCLGPLLVSFLRFYGARKNLNSDTQVEVEGAETVTFHRTAKVHEIQLAFEKAYVVLVKAQQKGRSSSIGANINQISSSVLAGLLNTEHLSKLRSQSQAFCASYQQRRQVRLAGSSSSGAVSLQGGETAESSFGDKVSLSQQLEVLRSNIQDTVREMQTALSSSSLPPSTASASASSSAALVPVPPPAAQLQSTNHSATHHQLTTDDPRTIFNPRDDIGRKIISGEIALPEYMVVADEHKLYLPQATQLRLGPFRSLALSNRYTSKTLEQLLAMQSTEESNIAGWLEQYRRSNAAQKATSAAASAFSPLTEQGKLILAGAIPVPPGMRLSEKQLQAIDLAKHCREGLRKLIQQRSGAAQKARSRPPTPEEEQLAVEAAVDAMMAAARSATTTPEPVLQQASACADQPMECSAVPAPARAQAPAGIQQFAKPISLSLARSSAEQSPRQQGVVDGSSLNVVRNARWQALRSKFPPASGADQQSIKLAPPRKLSEEDDCSMSSHTQAEGTAEAQETLDRECAKLNALKDLLSEPKYFGHSMDYLALECDTARSKILDLQRRYEAENGAVPVRNAHIFDPHNVLGRLYLAGVIKLPAAMHVPSEYISLVRLVQQEQAKLDRLCTLNTCIGAALSRPRKGAAGTASTADVSSAHTALPPPAQAIAERQCWESLLQDPAFHVDSTTVHNQNHSQGADVGRKIIAGKMELPLSLVVKHQLRRCLLPHIAPIKTSSAEQECDALHFLAHYSPRVRKLLTSSATNSANNSASSSVVDLSQLGASQPSPAAAGSPESSNNLSAKQVRLIESARKGQSALSSGASPAPSDQATEMEEVASTADSTMHTADSDTETEIEAVLEQGPSAPPVAPAPAPAAAATKGSSSPASKLAKPSAEALPVVRHVAGWSKQAVTHAVPGVTQTGTHKVAAPLQASTAPPPAATVPARAAVSVPLPKPPVPAVSLFGVPVPVSVSAAAAKHVTGRRQRQQQAPNPPPAATRSPRAVTPPHQPLQQHLHFASSSTAPYSHLVPQPTQSMQSVQMHTYSHYDAPGAYAQQQPAYAHRQSQQMPHQHMPVPDYSQTHERHQPQQPYQPPPPLQAAPPLHHPPQQLYYATHSVPQPDLPQITQPTGYQQWPQAESATVTQPLHQSYSQQVPCVSVMNQVYQVPSSASPPLPFDYNATAVVPQMQMAPASVPAQQYTSNIYQQSGPAVHSAQPLPWSAEQLQPQPQQQQQWQQYPPPEQQSSMQQPPSQWQSPQEQPQQVHHQVQHHQMQMPPQEVQQIQYVSAAAPPSTQAFTQWGTHAPPLQEPVHGPFPPNAQAYCWYPAHPPQQQQQQQPYQQPQSQPFWSQQSW